MGQGEEREERDGQEEEEKEEMKGGKVKEAEEKRVKHAPLHPAPTTATPNATTVAQEHHDSRQIFLIHSHLQGIKL